MRTRTCTAPTFSAALRSGACVRAAPPPPLQYLYRAQSTGVRHMSASRPAPCSRVCWMLVSVKSASDPGASLAPLATILGMHDDGRSTPQALSGGGVDGGAISGGAAQPSRCQAISPTAATR
ncbi:hypothetical protein PF010_g14172 [Phytophthora fragariae]|uniref:Uncharacterized protein n=1 Tax=Phytophthora fragariae TaxID=53985 RepID=A0A6G0KYD4_9STRA|nr:hypothetical protein PF010_g14172 [Phytophthora fragariae]KAE9219030.1 hypothetical protein PF004_g13719 [Phytophthora fragariae]